jgi:hypothetical protein
MRLCKKQTFCYQGFPGVHIIHIFVVIVVLLKSKGRLNET